MALDYRRSVGSHRPSKATHPLIQTHEGSPAGREIAKRGNEFTSVGLGKLSTDLTLIMAKQRVAASANLPSFRGTARTT